MTSSYRTSHEIQQFALWEKLSGKRALMSFDLELTARCTNHCRHCYINLPANDTTAQARELTIDTIARIADEAVELGAMWCLLTGGDPLLRPDFPEIYLMLKRKGLLVSVFTTATLVNEAHLELFRRYPPRDIEVTVYGVTAETYDRVTRRPGSFTAFQRGLDALYAAGMKIRLKAMALRSNVHELPAIAEFCRARTKDYFRFDPVLHLRYDRDAARNAEIQAERLTPAEVRALEDADPKRALSVERECQRRDGATSFDYLKCQTCAKADACETLADNTRLLGCGAGNGSCTIGYDGTFRLCGSLTALGMTADLRQVSLRTAWENVVPRVRALRTANMRLLTSCRTCPLVNLCLWCPAHAYLETGDLEGATPYFCEVAHARAR